MQVNDTHLIDAAVQTVNVIGELDPVVSNHIRSTTNAGSRIVTMLGHLIAGTGNDKTGSGRDVKGVLLVTTCAYDINIAFTIQLCRNTCLQNTVTKAEQLINGDSPHLKSSQQGCHLFHRELTFGDTNQNVMSLLTSQFLVIEHSV